MRRVQGIGQPRKQCIVRFDRAHIAVVRLAGLRFFLDLVEMKFQAETIDNATRLLPRCTLDAAVLSNRVQAVLVWYPGIVCGCRTQGCFKVLVHCIIRAGPAAQFKDGGARFIYRDAVNFPALLHAEHDCQFFLVPYRMPAQKLQKPLLLFTPLCKVCCDTFLRKRLLILVHDLVKLLFEFVHHCNLAFLDFLFLTPGGAKPKQKKRE
jgi:hypothetical protein